MKQSPRMCPRLKLKYFDNMKVSVPSSSEDYLEYVYGASWKTPIKNYNWIKDSPSTKDINI